MGARQSKRSVDITTTPKKGDGDAAPVSEDKIEKLGDADIAEVVTNGTATHKDIEVADKVETKESEEKLEKVKGHGLSETSDGKKTPDIEDASTTAAGDQSSKPTKSTTEPDPESGDKVAEKPDAKKQKEKKKKKWSLRSISFSKKDKSKPSKDKEKNGEVEEINEEKEEENTTSEKTNSDENKVPTEGVQEVASAEETTTKFSDVEESATKKDSAPKEHTTTNVESEAEKASANPTEHSSFEVNNEQQKEEPVQSEEGDKIRETAAAPSVIEEVKEVRNEDVPPPLPYSNPPSHVAVSAETLKGDSLLIETNVTSHISKLLLPQCEAVKETTNKEALVNTELKIESVEISSDYIECMKKESELAADTQKSCLSKNLEKEESANESLELNEHEIKSDTEGTESNELVKNEIFSAGDSSLLSVEALSEPNEKVVQNVPSSNDLVLKAKENINEQLCETSNLAGIYSKEATISTLEHVLTTIENTESNTSVPAIFEDEISAVSHAGDVPNAINSQTSLECDAPIQEIRSDVCLKESSQTSQLCSEEQSLDLSIIPETVESKEINSVEEKTSQPESSPSTVNIENGQNEKDSINVETIPSSPPKDVEQLCNTDSLADLSTESLPSLPEPTDSVLEPMSLPPLDSVPDPLTDDNIPSESPVIETNETEVALTNGNAMNGMRWNADDANTPLPPSLDGPLKQAVTEVTHAEEMSPSIGGKADTVLALNRDHKYHINYMKLTGKSSVFQQSVLPEAQ